VNIEDLPAEIWAVISPYVGWVVGMDWPQADEDAIYAKAGAHTAAGKAVEHVGTSGDATFAAVKASIDGAAADEFGEYWKKFTESDPKFLPNLTKLCDEAAERLKNYGLDVEYTKYMIIGSLILLAYQIWYFIAMAGPTFGESLSLIPGACTIAKLGVRELAQKLLNSIVLRNAIIRSVLVMEGMDAGIQLLQMAEGHRTEWDLDKTKMAVEGGVLTGLTFAGIGKAMSRLGGPRLATSLARAEMSGRERLADFMTKTAGGHMVQSAAANMTASVPMLAASGQLDFEHLAKAGTSGLLGGADGHVIKPTHRYADGASPSVSGLPHDDGEPTGHQSTTEPSSLAAAESPPNDLPVPPHHNGAASSPADLPVPPHHNGAASSPVLSDAAHAVERRAPDASGHALTGTGVHQDFPAAPTSPASLADHAGPHGATEAPRPDHTGAGSPTGPDRPTGHEPAPRPQQPAGEHDASLSTGAHDPADGRPGTHRPDVARTPLPHEPVRHPDASPASRDVASPQQNLAHPRPLPHEPVQHPHASTSHSIPSPSQSLAHMRPLAHEAVPAPSRIEQLLNGTHERPSPSGISQAPYPSPLHSGTEAVHSRRHGEPLPLSDPREAHGENPRQASHGGPIHDGGLDLARPPKSPEEAVEKLADTRTAVRQLNDATRSEDLRIRAAAKIWEQHLRAGMDTLGLRYAGTTYHYTFMPHDRLSEVVRGSELTTHGFLESQSVHWPFHEEPVELVIHSRTGSHLLMANGKDQVLHAPGTALHVLAVERYERPISEDHVRPIHRIFAVELPRDGSPLPGTAGHPGATTHPRRMDQRLQRLFNDRVPTRAGVAYFTPEQRMDTRFHVSKPIDGVFDLDIHGNGSHFQTGSEPLSARDAAVLLSNEPELIHPRGDRPVIRLLSCYGAQDLHSLAQEFANESGYISIAPEREVEVDEFGNVHVDSTVAEPDQPAFKAPDGAWKIFIPEG
jgi:hypothetical protein